MFHRLGPVRYHDTIPSVLRARLENVRLITGMFHPRFNPKFAFNDQKYVYKVLSSNLFGYPRILEILERTTRKNRRFLGEKSLTSIRFGLRI